jgi:aldehyde dehydrogenase (NAD+)
MTTLADALATLDYGPSPEAPGPAQGWLQRAPFGHFIAGSFTRPADLFHVINPATGAVLAQVSHGSERDVDAAVRAARKAAKGWARTPGTDRARTLYALARRMQKHARLFATLETLNNGKPIRESRDIDVPLAIRHFYHHAGWAALTEEEFPGRAPHSVCGQIIPWNFPLLMLAWKVAPALAAGNTVVLKPAEYTPLTALLFAELCAQSGVPAGVVNIVTGDGRTGAAWSSIRTSPRSPSPARPKSAARSGQPLPAPARR